MKNALQIIVLMQFIPCILFSQFTLKDSLRGSLRMERDFDVRHYELHVNINIKNKSIEGFNRIQFIAKSDLTELQLDLFENMKIIRIEWEGKVLPYYRKHDAFFIRQKFSANQKYVVTVFYEGSPIKSKNPPWDGGFVWTTDDKKNPWVAVACEGTGASLWWPNKDHLGDEPEEGVDIFITAPSDLSAVANGNLIREDLKANNQTTSHWKVSYPINNYNVTFYVGKYIHFSDFFDSKNGRKLQVDLFLLDNDTLKAKNYFKQINKVLEAFEHYLAPYPFWEDGYALVEAPFAGMEHQSAIAYGPKFKERYSFLVDALPLGSNEDYLILHESGHEYFGNSVSCTDLGELWLHESFTTYLEALYVEYFYGKEVSKQYLDNQRFLVANKNSIVGPLGVNWDELHNTDIYYKGSWFLHSLRTVINQDSVWFPLLKDFYLKHELSQVNTQDFINHVNQYTKKNFSPFIRQYLHYAEIPIIEYKWIVSEDKRTKITYRLNCAEAELSLPFHLKLENKAIPLEATNEWRNMEFSRVFKNVMVDTSKILIGAKLLPWNN